MNELIEMRIKEACSSNQLKDLYMVDVHEAVLDVFRKINYTPSDNINQAVDKA